MHAGQWLLRTVVRCFKAWQKYKMRRQLQRELGYVSDEALEGDAPPGEGPRLAETVSSMAAKVTSLF